MVEVTSLDVANKTYMNSGVLPTNQRLLNRDTAMMRRRTVYAFLLLSLLPLSAVARPFVLVLSQDDLIDAPSSSAADGDSSSSAEWDEFGDSDAKPEDLDPGSWRLIFEPDSPQTAAESAADDEAAYYSAVAKMVDSVSSGEPRGAAAAAAEIEAAASGGYPHAQSGLGFLYNMGMSRERNRAKAFMYHYFAADGGNMQSKMALAYTYSRQDVCHCSLRYSVEFVLLLLLCM
ncbi:HCP-like superfamily protein [Actinidia rufa]|uniref:HCP-like superfamily protein n=1 Tax=Actinidia rufa TaxID=165716 RepID=A0A7J0FY82_9ERIC|nr:HCP-like superfamily protein [Actinidia rufa]